MHFNGAEASGLEYGDAASLSPLACRPMLAAINGVSRWQCSPGVAWRRAAELERRQESDENPTDWVFAVTCDNPGQARGTDKAPANR
jgi:hypothetical protein